jgi:hypothetical protein
MAAAASDASIGCRPQSALLVPDSYRATVTVADRVRRLRAIATEGKPAGGGPGPDPRLVSLCDIRRSPVRSNHTKQED